jgi:hypothetical protein
MQVHRGEGDGRNHFFLLYDKYHFLWRDVLLYFKTPETWNISTETNVKTKNKSIGLWSTYFCLTWFYMCAIWNLK